MKKYFSSKIAKINILNSLVDTINDMDKTERINKLIVHTANGLYIGSLKKYDDTNYEIKDDDDFLTAYRKMYLEAMDKADSDISNEDVRVTENPITITLENVEVISNNNVRSYFSFVEIFIDQIIGISLGDISQDKQN